MKKYFGIIGNPIKHSLSPVLHNYWFKKYGINADYTLIDIKQNEISELVQKIRKKKYLVLISLFLTSKKSYLM